MYFLIDYENRTELGTLIGSFTFEANEKPLSSDPELRSLALKEVERTHQVSGKVSAIYITSITLVD